MLERAADNLKAAFRRLDENRHRAEFYRLWATTFAAGYTHPGSMEAMGVRESRREEEARRCVLEGVLQGHDLGDLLRMRCSDRFEDLERALISVGVESGGLDRAFQQLSEFYERKHQLMLWVRKRIAYPLVTALAACFVVPLPLLMYGQTAAYLASAVAGSAVVLVHAQTIVAVTAAWYGRRPRLARARMARALATAIQAGLTIPRSVRLAADASSNAPIQQFVQSIDDRTLAIAPIAESLAGCPHLTADFVAVLRTAERTGDFSVIARLAELYEDGFR